MKALLSFCLAKLLIFTMLCLPCDLIAQNEKVNYSLAENRNFSHWSYMIDVGISIFDGDVHESVKRLFPNSKIKPTFGVNGEYTFNPIFGTGLRYRFIPYKAETSTYEVKGLANDLDVFASINLLNLFYRNRSQKWNLYGNIGLGYSSYSAKQTNKETGELCIALDNEGKPIKLKNGDYEKMNLKNGDAFVFPVSLHLEYNINTSFAIGLQTEYRMYNKDNLEGSPVNIRKGNSNDAIGLLTVSLRHKINSKDKKAHIRNISY